MNRIFLLVICLLLPISGCWGQAVFLIDSLPAQGVLLDKGWKFHAGDNQEWAKPEFDDRQWESIDPTQDIMDLQKVRKAGTGWFRLRLVITQAVRNESLALLIQQTGASEIYLNGHLLHRFGLIDRTSKAVHAYTPQGQPVSFPVLNDSLQTLSIRFAFDDKLLYGGFYGGPNRCLWINVNGVTNAVRYDHVYRLSKAYPEYLKIGLFLILTVLHLAFYVYYPKQRANLYFSLFSLFSTLTYLLQAQASRLHQMDWLQATLIAITILTTLFHLFLVTALYALFKQPKGIIYGFLIVYFIICIPLTVWPYHTGVIYGPNFFSLVSLLEATRISILAFKRKRRGSTLIIRGVIVALLFLLTHAALLPYRSAFVGYMFINPDNPLYFMAINLPYNISYLSIPVAISLYLGLEFAFTNKSLEAKLIEVGELSAQTLAQEQEKQQLLAQQNEMLERQVNARTSELKHSLENLKTTQTQLIQREKMASLGELTAGIAHEIQNPLNFVNNFSEVSTELVDELEAEMDRGEMGEAKVIAADLRQNLQKITYHGSRASAIVKGMLEHSHTATGERQSTDLNVLTNEYLRLAYQGVRAKDKEFTCELVTQFDTDLGLVEVVPQEIGRVLLNLFNNAFYAVQEKQKTVPVGYQPTITVSTQRSGSGVEIRVRDNGTGIPESVKAKIFHPFFTTKPTGKGTGLGLSLSYDIVTKGHSGILTVESQEGEGTTFLIQLLTAKNM